MRLARRKKNSNNRLRQFVEYCKINNKADDEVTELFRRREILQKYTIVIGIIQKYLPSRLSMALLLRYKHSYTYKKIADEMQIDVASARRYICVGIKRTQKLLKEHGLYQQCRT